MSKTEHTGEDLDRRVKEIAEEAWRTHPDLVSDAAVALAERAIRLALTGWTPVDPDLVEARECAALRASVAITENRGQQDAIRGVGIAISKSKPDIIAQAIKPLSKADEIASLGDSSCSAPSSGVGEGVPSEARTPADYAVEFGGYLAKSAEAFLDFLNETSAFAESRLDAGDRDALRDHRQGLRSAIYEFTKRASRYRAALSASPSPTPQPPLHEHKSDPSLGGGEAELRRALEFIAAFADVRSKDDSKTFARVNRGALRTIAEKARAALSLLSQGVVPAETGVSSKEGR